MVTHWIYTRTVGNRHFTCYLPVEGAAVSMGTLSKGTQAVLVRDLDLEGGRSQVHTFATLETLADRLRFLEVDKAPSVEEVDDEELADDEELVDERQTLQVAAV